MFSSVYHNLRFISVGVVKGLKVMIANVRDLKSGMKYGELQLLAVESELDIVAITESWANFSVMDAELSLGGFRMFRKDRERDVEQKSILILSFSFFSISFSSLTIFFSIPQAAENSPFSSFLSSLAYLLSTGLTPWNFDSACFSFIIHSVSFILDPFICSTRFNFMFCHIVCRNKLTGIQWIPVSFMMHSKSSSYQHIFHFTFSHFISFFVCHMHVVV